MSQALGRAELYKNFTNFVSNWYSVQNKEFTITILLNDCTDYAAKLLASGV